MSPSNLPSGGVLTSSAGCGYFEANKFENMYVWIIHDVCMIYCKVRNINVEVILAILTSGSDSLMLRSVNICSIL